MSFIELSVTSKEFNISLQLFSRITLLRGNSGICKSLFFDLLTRDDVTVKKTYTLAPSLLLTTSMFESISGIKNVIFLFDDEAFTDTALCSKFEELYSTYAISNNQYYLIADRGELEFSSLSYSVYDILTLVANDGINYRTKEMYRYLNDSGTSSKIVTEDGGSGYTFVKNYCNKVEVESADGKGNFNNGHVDMTNAVAFVDMYAFGCHITEFANKANIDNRKLFYSVGSFEKLLLDIGGYVTSSNLDVNLFKSKEIAFEQAMSDMEDSFLLKTVHGRKAALCLRTDCMLCYKCLYQNCKQPYTMGALTELLKKHNYGELCMYNNTTAIKNPGLPLDYSVVYLLCALSGKFAWYSINDYSIACNELEQVTGVNKMAYIMYNKVSKFIFVNNPLHGKLLRCIKFMQKSDTVLGLSDSLPEITL